MWLLGGGVGIVFTIGVLALRSWRARAIDGTHEDAPSLPIVEPSSTEAYRYLEWIAECRGRVGIVGDLRRDTIDVGAERMGRIVFALDTGETVTLWTSGPDWMGPFPRVCKSSWREEAHVVASTVNAAAFEQTLLLARGPSPV